jgi:hypothetical protein
VVEEVVAQTHLGGDVSKQAINACSDTPAFDQGGGIGVSELMRCDVSKACCVDRPVQLLPYCVLRESFSVMGEQEIGWRSAAWIPIPLLRR